MRKTIILAGLAFALSASAAGPTDWQDLQFLVGDWTAEAGAGGVPGQASSGGFSFAPELGGKILVRKSRSEYPATKDHPATVHEDLMILYRETASTPVEAVFFDSEGHVIRYVLRVSPAHDRFEFVSGGETPGPRYRLTYARIDENRASVSFDVAPPGSPDAFRTYVQGNVRRAH